MFDKPLVIDILDQIIEAVEVIEERCSFANRESDFTDSKEGQEKLDSICMKLIAIGESLKKIDSITQKTILEQYKEIEWKKIKGIRDFISHHYFDLDAEVIFGICKNHTKTLRETLIKIRSDLSN